MCSCVFCVVVYGVYVERMKYYQRSYTSWYRINAPDISVAVNEKPISLKTMTFISIFHICERCGHMIFCTGASIAKTITVNSHARELFYRIYTCSFFCFFFSSLAVAELTEDIELSVCFPEVAFA